MLAKKEIYFFSIFAMALVLVLVLYMLFIAAPSTAAYDNKPVSNSVLAELSGISANATLMNEIGNGSITPSLYPVRQHGKAPLLSGTKPQILFISADYCPYCAATRWSLIIALMRFGNFTSLHYMSSSTADYSPGTPTFTFYNSSYSSAIINFNGIELANNILNSSGSYTPLDNLTKSQKGILNAYDYDKAIPFFDAANYSVCVGALSSPLTIQKLNWSTIIEQLKDPDSQVSQELIGAANVFTAQICGAINNTAKVCQSAAIKEIESQQQ